MPVTLPRSRVFVAVVSALVMLGVTHAASADHRGGRSVRSAHVGFPWHAFRGGFPGKSRERSFNRIATIPNYLNRPDAGDETVSEIVSVSKDGRLLVYTDSPGEAIGVVGIQNPRWPLPLGIVALGGEPTSVAMLGNDLALVGVNTSEDFDAPSGHLAVVDVDSFVVVAQLDLGGQPDSVKISPDGRYVAVAIENERDEDVEVDGVEGGLPQLPAGFLAIVDVIGADPAAWTVRTADLTGLSSYAPDDPEPEFVDVNGNNQAVVTLQENNHLILVDLATGTVTADFDAGTVDLDEIDTVEDGVISLDGSLTGIPREPDAVTWIPAGRAGYAIATANEGDLFGGSRGFSIFAPNGSVLFDSGNELEHIAVMHGHYPEDRSENKGTEPESIAYGRYGRDEYLFVGSERGSFVAVYELDDGKPEFKQLLPAPLGPEGLLPIPSRNLLVVAGEEDDPTFGVRSTMMIYSLEPKDAQYPQIVSEADASGLPIPWAALSGMTGMPGEKDKLLAVWDSYYAESRIFTIDVSARPAVIESATTIAGGTGNYDPEGIAIAPDGTYWIASEGNAGSRPNRLLQTDAHGTLLAEIGLPPEIEACRAASENRGTLGSGFEGVAVLPKWRGYELLVAQQRGWDYTTPECEDLDDDAGGLDAHGEPKRTRIWVYDPEAGSWDHFAWELAPLPENASWVGLSEITAGPFGSYIVIERDNRTGTWAELKTLARFNRWGALDGLVSARDKRVYDLIRDLDATHGWISDKTEGVGITPRGEVFVVTDNDGVEDWSGETWFLELGSIHKLERRFK
jgi:hypothetical protein